MSDETIPTPPPEEDEEAPEPEKLPEPEEPVEGQANDPVEDA